MKHFLRTTTLTCLLLAAACSTDAPRPIDCVDPNIGTVHSRWFFYTPASEPFGMAKLGASTNGSYGNQSGWQAVGYEDGHTSIEGFPCFHEFQVGGVMLMPVVGEPKTAPGLLDDPASGYRSTFDKASETARPGYYAVTLRDYGVRAELTATTRVGFQRYTFPASDNAHILFDIGNRLGESGPVRDAEVVLTSPTTVEGWIVTEPVYVQKYQQGARVNLYFHAELSKPAASCRVFLREGELREGDRIEGTGAGMALGYATREGETIEVKLGLSYTSVANARENLAAEARDLDFDDALASCTAKWESALGRIRVEGGTEASRTKFYTGLYHALLGRGVASDMNGAYPRNDGGVGQIPLDKSGKPIHHHYNTDAMWGAYWNLTQLWALAYPEYYNDFVQSQVLIYKDAGWLGDGIACSKYVSGVGTNMVPIVLAGAYNSGIRDFDVEEAYRAALKNEIEWIDRPEGAGKTDVGHFVRQGYVPYVDLPYNGTDTTGSAFSVSHTLEYCFSSYAVAQWAKQLGREEDYRRLMELSRGWQQLFDPETRLIRPRTATGEFIGDFDPLQSWRGFQEGNAMQYTYFVPHDPQRLIGLVGQERFNRGLDSLFTVARESIFGGGKVIDAFSGLQSPYNHGNQPSLHIAWLFNFSGAPYLTQQWTRRICDEFYGTTGEHGYGYGQDEDQGQLGAWYVMAALGLFDVQGGASARPTFQLGSPQFDRIEIDLSPMNSAGGTFVIETENNAPENCYIQSATLDGQPLDDCWLYRDRIYRAGRLKLTMGSAPNTAWGAANPPACTE